MDYRIRAGILSWLIGGVLCLLIYACAGVEIMGVCRHEATYAVSVFGELYPVRVALGELRVGDARGDHAQGQAFVKGKWQWLCVDYPVVFICPVDSSFTPDAYLPSVIWGKYIMVPLTKD